jgi:Flp pilus assembly protein TadD
MAKRPSKKKAPGTGSLRDQKTATDLSKNLSTWSSRDWLGALLLMLAVVLAYQPVWHAGYIWDDPEMVTANPCIVGPLGLIQIWTTGAADICPLTLTTFWVEHALWGVAPLPYHLVNVLLQGACAVALWRVLRSLRVPGAWLGAALWAMHPVQVESVAWITETKNTQSGLFFLLSILFFVRGLRTRDPERRSGFGWNYALTLLFAALAMASKSSTVILPVILCLCAWWVEGRWQGRSLAKTGPVFLMALAAGVVSIWVQKQNGATNPEWTQTWPQRIATAGDAVWFYLGKLLWPHPLMTLYPRWKIDAGLWFSYLPLLAVMLILFLLWRQRSSWGRPWFLAWTYFLVALLPILGLVPMVFFGYTFVADHFQYLASMGPLALAGAGFARMAEAVLPGKKWLPSSLCAGPLLILGTLSWHRAQAYENEGTLWTDTLAKNPVCWPGFNNLGLFLMNQGNVDKAISKFQRALEIRPGYVDAYTNLGTAFFRKGQVDTAMAQFQKALQIDPDSDAAHNGLANTLVQKGRLEEAIAQYEAAVKLNPGNGEAHFNLGLIFLQKGQASDAAVQFQEVLRLNPQDNEARENLARVQASLHPSPGSE